MGVFCLPFNTNMSYSTEHSGDISTTDYRVFCKRDGNYVSYLHDIPLYANEEKTVLNMVVEIPRGTNAKMEICLKEEGNPIKQDVKNGKLRFVDDVHPYQGYIWNYGALPQTWEMPTHKHPETNALGVMALIDEGETDWKVIVIDVNDPRASEFNDISDVQRLMPGFTMATYEWFRTYKMPAGKPANEFAFNGEAKNAEYTRAVIAENYNFWKRINTGSMPAKGDKYDVACANVSCEGSPHKTDSLNISVSEFKDQEVAANELPQASGVKLVVEAQQRASPH